MTICPCCGDKFAGDLSKGCNSCGARSVGEPLPKPEHELPSYGRSLLLVVTGALMVLVFVVQVIIALVQQIPFSLSFWSFMSAGQTAAWRLKWISVPVAFLVLLGCRKVYRSILAEPARFCGLNHARRGLLASCSVCMLIAGLIGISVPARLRNRQYAIDAAYAAHVHRIDRGFIEYVIRFKTLPSETADLKRLPDPDGSLAEAIRELGPLGPSAYKPSGADVAALPNKKPRTLRGAVIRNASVDSGIDDTLAPGLAFTNYELRLPGPDKIPGTDDDLVVRDGLITKATEAGPGIIGSTASTSAAKP